jgi:hypothetical protein
MRSYLLVAALALGSVTGCSKSPLAVNPPMPTPTAVQVHTPARSPGPSRTPKQNSTGVAAVASMPPRPRRLAPEGTYFLLRFVSITTPSGVVGLPPGMKVTVLAHQDTSFEVTDADNHVFQITESEITNDIDLGIAAGRRDAALQWRIRNQIAADARKYDEEQAKRWAEEEKAARQRTPSKPRPQ